MGASCFALEGPFHVAVECGSDPRWDQAVEYFRRELGTERSSGSAALTLVASGGVSHSPDEIYGVSGGLSKAGRFIVPDGAGHWCAMDPAQLVVSEDLHVELDLCCPLFKPNVLLDWIMLPAVQFASAAAGLTPLHASAASGVDGVGPVVFSAWSGVGKTNLLLEAMRRGGSYYGDDRVYVGRGGEILPSSRRVSIYGYNRRLASGLSPKAKRGLALGDALHRAARNRRGRAAFVLAYAANGLGATRASAIELGGHHGVRTDVQAHVICRAVSDSRLESGLPVLTDWVDRDLGGLALAHIAVMEYEFVWFRRFLQTWLWAGPGSRDPWLDLAEAWKSNLQQYFSVIPQMFSLSLPRGGPVDAAPKAWRAVTGRLCGEVDNV